MRIEENGEGFAAWRRETERVPQAAVVLGKVNRKFVRRTGGVPADRRLL